MTSPTVFTPYSTATALSTALPSWVTGQDQGRIAAYELYEQIFWSHDQAFALTWRGTPDRPVYLPSGRTIVEACNRFLGKGFSLAADPARNLSATPEATAAIRMGVDQLLRREQFMAKMNSQKRFGLIRGDSVWHITADATKLPGTRISMYEVDPASYFPITDPVNPDRIVGVHIVEQWTKEGTTEVVAKRQTYRKLTNGQISSELMYFKLSGWDDREGQKIEVVSDPTYTDAHAAIVLPPAITSIPVYHIKNFRSPTDPFGSSEMRGLERIMAAVNQTMSDQELALALDGLGVYTSGSGKPIDPVTGDEVEWSVYPGAVVENVTDFKRVAGIGTVTPNMDHVNALIRSMREASGTPDIAVGSVDVSAVASGVALQLQLNPVLAKNEEKETEMLGTYDNMFYDITNAWLPTYEALPTGVVLTPSFGSPVPKDRAAVLAEVTAMVSSKIVSEEWARTYLADKLGYTFPEDMATQIDSETGAHADAQAGTFDNRVASEAGTSDETGT